MCATRAASIAPASLSMVSSSPRASVTHASSKPRLGTAGSGCAPATSIIVIGWSSSEPRELDWTPGGAPSSGQMSSPKVSVPVLQMFTIFLSTRGRAEFHVYHPLRAIVHSRGAFPTNTQERLLNKHTASRNIS